MVRNNNPYKTSHIFFIENPFCVHYVQDFLSSIIIGGTWIFVVDMPIQPRINDTTSKNQTENLCVKSNFEVSTRKIKKNVQYRAHNAALSIELEQNNMIMKSKISKQQNYNTKLCRNTPKIKLNLNAWEITFIITTLSNKT